MPRHHKPKILTTALLFLTAAACSIKKLYKKPFLILPITLSVLLMSSCSENESAAFCDATRDLVTYVDQINVNSLASTLGPEFWQSFSQNVGELTANAPDQLEEDIKNLNEDLNNFIEKLEARDYNLLSTILDPETLTSFTKLVEDILATVSQQIYEFAEQNCTN